jgi:S1-C subfamily serine protease
MEKRDVPHLFIKTIRLLLFPALLSATSCAFGQTRIPDAVIKVFSYRQSVNPRLPWLNFTANESRGSAFVIEGGHILTNAHVVRQSKYIELKKQDNSKRYPARVRFINHACDVASLEVDDPDFFEDIHPLQLGGIPELDTVVKTVGFPMGGEKISITNGVISRIEKIIYSHTGVDEHLAIQTDAAINPGNSGGPVLQNGKVVGMAFQGIRSGDNIGYMIPTTIIRHFIEDALDGTIHNIPEMGVYYNPLPPVMRRFLKLPEDESGILVIATHPAGPARGHFRENDILTRIAGHSVSDDGTISLDGITVPFYEIMERSQYQDEIEVEGYRKGEKFNETILLKKFHRPLDVGSTYEIRPPYLIHGGLVFVKLSGDYMKSFGKKWWRKIPHFYRLLYYYQAFIDREPERKRFIVLSEVLPDPDNLHARRFSNQIIESVNGRKVLAFDDLTRAFEECETDFIVIRFQNQPVPLIIERTKALAIQEDLLLRHNIPRDKRLSEQEDAA